uniref:Chitin binding protein n=1 Tax=Lymantria dispar multicapsid nuclear polyhedrosis virus TaxID=10449 RepID=A0A0A0YWG3_NPVLD|nr:ChtB1 [Lymantria dispar multiple nucleopolyhedrovirus]AJR20288.1 chtB1 [Lymantria dispar multiple nucleopolyhedrovirus]AMO27515.1 ChtB1 [Lymantria dispar multiple nucleopolyhedrovirus]AQQ80039.1 chtB1 [Lymantria dispar multiple nucleopolyhedrovirus]QCQ67269.1 ChtB1 [Lymantria dispar multiple nucleopolyhedrovirus]
MWLLLAFFIVVKLLVFHKMQKLQLNMHLKQLCPAGYHGLVEDPFDCNAYHVCPQTSQCFCGADEQFDLEAQSCVPASTPGGCVDRRVRALLL